MARIEILEEVCSGSDGDWRLCFQWTRYHYDDNEPQMGYRFIWRRPDGSLQAARGQARIPSAGEMFDLISRASAKGWFVAIESTRDDE